MTTEETMRPLQRFYDDLINQGDLSVIPEIIGPNYINHAAPFGLDQGVTGLTKLLEEFIIAFPDQHIVAEQMFVHGDRVVAYWRITGTHQGKFFGVEPTGKKMEMTGIDIERVVDGKIVEHWGAEDMMILLSQIGAIVLPDAS